MAVKPYESDKLICTDCGYFWEPIRTFKLSLLMCPQSHGENPGWPEDKIRDNPKLFESKKDEQHCFRCNHDWTPRRHDSKLTTCPKCNSYRWREKDLPLAWRAKKNPTNGKWEGGLDAHCNQCDKDFLIKRGTGLRCKHCQSYKWREPKAQAKGAQ